MVENDEDKERSETTKVWTKDGSTEKETKNSWFWK